MAKRYELNDQQWARIAEMLPGKKSDPGRTAKDNRLFVNGVLWVLRSGAHWHDPPERYGKWKTVHTRFARWAKSGVWEWRGEQLPPPSCRFTFTPIRLTRRTSSAVP